MRIEKIRKKLCEIQFLNFIYEKVYLRYIAWKRFNVKVIGDKKKNTMEIPSDTFCNNLRIVFKGQKNFVKIGRGCTFKQKNTLYMQGDGNSIVIGDNVVFDSNVLIVCAEGTECVIGSDSIFADKVHIRTSDQHFIYNDNGNRVNFAKNVKIGNHVWIGASAIVMKGASIEDGAVVGIGSTVLGCIPKKSVAVGSPAKVVKSNIYWQE